MKISAQRACPTTHNIFNANQNLDGIADFLKLMQIQNDGKSSGTKNNASANQSCSDAIKLKND